MDHERLSEIDLIRLMEDVYKTKFAEAGIPSRYEEMEGTAFKCEHFSLKESLLLSTNQLLDLYSDYHAMYQLTGDRHFEARAKNYLHCLKTKQERRVN